MERTVRTQRTLSKQEEIDEGDELLENYDSGGNKSSSPELNSINKGDDQLPTSNSPPTNNSINNNNNNSNNNNLLHRSRSQSKVKLLVRSHAVREETSPPPDPPASPPQQQQQQQQQTTPPLTNGTSCSSGTPPAANTANNSNSPQQQQPPAQTQPSLRVRHKLRREGSSQGSTESWEPTLSRGNSREQYDGSNTVDLQQFIAETLNRNYKDRLLLLKIENELLNLAKDPKRTVHKFGQMSSYQRMLVHRVAAYFGMEHNVDPTGASVIVNTTKATRVPDRRFRDFVREDLLLPEEPRRSILKRDSSSFDETGCFKSGDRMLNGESRRSKSFEEREEEYEKARRRIFNREHSTDGEVECMDELHWEGDTLCSQCEQSGRIQSHSSTIDRNVRLLKVESYESSDTLRANSLRLSVSKSHSFNGYDPPQNARILTKQDSGSSMSSRISPSSSGYKSQRSDATLSATPSPTATPNLHTQLSSQSGAMSPEPDTPVVWAVTDMASVPPGSMLIHPQTGQPYTNPDGTIYHFDPANPPRVSAEPSLQQHAGASTSQHPQQVQAQHHQQNKPSDCSESEATNPPSTSGSSQDKPPQPVQQYDTNHQPQPQETRVCTSCVGVGPGGQGYVGPPLYQGGIVAAPAPPPPPPPPPYPQQYSVMIPPPHAPADPTPQYHPATATAVVCPSYIPHQYPDPRISSVVGWQDGSTGGGNELTTYMMGLSLDPTRAPPPPPPDARAAPPTPLYWSHHLQPQGGGQGVPVYYTGGGGQTNGTARYQAAAAAGAPPPPAFTHPPQLVPPPPPPPPPPQQHPTDHSGGCYGPGYASTGPECIPYAAPTALHMYYSAAPCNNGSQQAAGQTGGGYYSGSVSACGAPLVTLQYQQPCTHPTPPHTPQGVCGQFAVYNSCYPTHYAPPNSALPVAQLFRKPALQVGVRCSSPLRPPYPGSPTMKERVGNDKQAPPPPPLQHSLPVYGIRVVPGDMRLLGNAGRLPFTLPTTKSTHTRKHRSKGGGAGGGGGGGAMANGNVSGGRVNEQQQQALASVIEVTGHHHHHHHHHQGQGQGQASHQQQNGGGSPMAAVPTAKA